MVEACTHLLEVRRSVRGTEDERPTKDRRDVLVVSKWMERAEHHRIVFALRKEIDELKAKIETLEGKALANLSTADREQALARRTL